MNDAGKHYQDGYMRGADNGAVMLAAEGDHPVAGLTLPLPGPVEDRKHFLRGFAAGLVHAANRLRLAADLAAKAAAVSQQAAQAGADTANLDAARASFEHVLDEDAPFRSGGVKPGE